jgi:hypothetical protein
MLEPLATLPKSCILLKVQFVHALNESHFKYACSRVLVIARTGHLPANHFSQPCQPD